LDHALAAVADGGADAIGAGVAAADDHDVTVFGREMRGDFRAVEETLGVRGPKSRKPSRERGDFGRRQA
jgi:hypothetical protein